MQPYEGANESVLGASSLARRELNSEQLLGCAAHAWVPSSQVSASFRSKPTPPQCKREDDQRRLVLQIAEMRALTECFHSLSEILDESLDSINGDEPKEFGNYNALAIEEMLDAADLIKPRV